MASLNILVTGAKGQLGSSIRKIVEENNLSDRYFFTDIDELDICDIEAVSNFVRDNNIDVVINCAAYTNGDTAEEADQRDIVYMINSEAPGNLAKVMAERDGILIHISTDYVFGGNFNNTPCTEEQMPNPTGVYGMSKLAGEKEIADTKCKAIILRTAWLYSEYGKNFVKTMLNLASSRPELSVVFDQCGTPTYAGDLAEAIIDILTKRKFNGKEGIYHYSNEGVCSWFDFTKQIAQLSGIENCRILPCHSNEFVSKVKRPAYSVLDKTKYKKTFGKDVPYWTDSLKKCLGLLASRTV